MNYDEFLDVRGQRGADSGFEPLFMPDFLFDFQKHVVNWAVRKGRGAVFADCGLGKTAMGLTWAQNVVQKTNRPVLYLTPLAVGAQTVSEANKFGLEAHQSKDGGLVNGVVVANYERLHYFNPSDFAGVVCDESSILKSFSGSTKRAVTAFMRQVPYRLLQTATAAPNDYIELGTSSEALGYLGYMDMLNKFFKNDLNNSAQGRMSGEVIKWRLKGHAELPFWRWICSWAIAIRRPSDLGFDDSRFVLPPLNAIEHLIDTENLRNGMLFALPAVGLAEQREERRNTINERCQKVAELVATDKPAIVWCHLNEEGSLLEKLIPDCVQVSGSDSDDRKETKLEDFANGRARVLVTKPKIGAWGLNFQHCSHVTFFPSHSFEQYYQAVRRCWRFGQKNAVKVDIVTTEGERGVMRNLQRKADQADEMFSRLVSEMNNAQAVVKSQRGTKQMEVPAWL